MLFSASLIPLRFGVISNIGKSSATQEVSKDDHGSGGGELPASAAQPQERKGSGPRAGRAISACRRGGKGTSKVAEDLKKNAKAKFEAELEAKLRRRKEKALRDAMIASALGGLYEAASVAERYGETEITFEMASGGN